MQRMLLGPTQAPLSGPYVRPQLLSCTAAPFSGEQSHLAQKSKRSSPPPPPHILGSSLPITADWGAGGGGMEKGRSEVGGGIRSQTFGPGASSAVLFMLRVPCGSGLAWAWLLLAWGLALLSYSHLQGIPTPGEQEPGLLHLPPPPVIAQKS